MVECMAYLLMVIFMNLTLIQRLSGSAKAKNQRLIILTTKQAILGNCFTWPWLWNVYMAWSSCIISFLVCLLLFYFFEGLGSPLRVTSGLFTSSNLTQVEYNTKHAHYTQTLNVKHKHNPKVSPFGIALIRDFFPSPDPLWPCIQVKVIGISMSMPPSFNAIA